MSIRIIIKIFLTLQLLLLIFRQMIDFAGIQWLMIIVNAIAIIITICAFFGYLLFYASFQIVLIVYNIYVICVYARFITLDSITNTNNGFVNNDQSTTTTLFREHKFYDNSDDNNDVRYPIDLDHIHHHNHHNLHHQQSSPSSSSLPLPSIQLLSFDINSKSFWYVIVSNHISNIQTHLNNYQSTSPSSSSSSSLPSSSSLSSLLINKQSSSSLSSSSAATSANILRHSTIDESLVDLCVQYIEIAIASLHILFSLLAIALILLKFKLERDKFFRNNDKTTPPLPPYTINPQMNHYMSFTPSISTNKSSIYTQNVNNGGSVRRSSKRRRSTRSLHTQKSKSNSLGALNIRANSSGSLRSNISKKGQHRKSATSLLINSNNIINTNNMINNNNMGDNSFISNNTTIGSARSGRSAKLTNSSSQHSASNYQISNIYGTINSNNNNININTPKSSLRKSNNHKNILNNQQQQQQQRHSVFVMNGVGGPTAIQHASKFLNSDSETDYYHTFVPPAYLNNGLANPLYGKRNSYLDSSETAI